MPSHHCSMLYQLRRCITAMARLILSQGASKGLSRWERVSSSGHSTRRRRCGSLVRLLLLSPNGTTPIQPRPSSRLSTPVKFTCANSEAPAVSSHPPVQQHAHSSRQQRSRELAGSAR